VKSMNNMNVALIVGSLSLISGSAWADTTVTIGSAAPLTGGIAQFGKDDEGGARLAVEEINHSGLVIGGQKIKLELDSQDDAGDPRTATQIAQHFVDEHVVAVVGHMNSGTSIPASRIYNDAGIVEISPGATNPVYTRQGFKTSFRVVATDAQQAPALANYAVGTMQVKSVVVVDDQTAYGQGLANSFESAAKRLGIQVLSHEAVSEHAVDFRGILTKIKGENPDAIMYGGVVATGGPFAKQAGQLNIRAKILGGDGLCSETLSELAGSSSDNVTCSVPGIALSALPHGAQFDATFKKRFGSPVQLFAPYSYDAVYVIVDAMKRAGSIDPAKILAKLPSTAYQGITGEIAFDSYGDLTHGAITIYQYAAGARKSMAAERL
jgi:branched-chain amino acid transport system substrate-binding protein